MGCTTSSHAINDTFLNLDDSIHLRISKAGGPGTGKSVFKPRAPHPCLNSSKTVSTESEDEHKESR